MIHSPRTSSWKRALTLALVAITFACSDDAESPVDAAAGDAAAGDLGVEDLGVEDPTPSQDGAVDAATPDAGSEDTGARDAEPLDASSSSDAGAGPEGWTCGAERYDDGRRCDCGCGLLDPDCNDVSSGNCVICDIPGSCAEAYGCIAIDYYDHSRCFETVCGNEFVEYDEQCDDGNTIPGDGCDADCRSEVPAGWTCPREKFGDGLREGLVGILCDCGCGVPDVYDCVDATVASCSNCLQPGSCAYAAGTCGVISPTQNAACTQLNCGDGQLGLGEECDDGNPFSGDGCNAACRIEVPPGWTCDPAWFGDGIVFGPGRCDCGCGAVDILDCENATAAACDSCDAGGSCSASECPGTIEPSNNGTCQ